MTLYRANFDYESELFWGKQDSWAVEMLEHLFFFCVGPEDVLFTKKSYPGDYLKFLKDALGHIPKTSSLGEPVNWWGNLNDDNLESKLNSKITSFEVSNKLGLNHPKSRFIMSVLELEGFLEEEKDIFIRHPYERAGRVSFRLNDKSKILKDKKNFEKILKEQPLLGDPYFKNRVWDLGTCMQENSGKFELAFQIKNLNDSQGVFRGAVLLEPPVKHEALNKIADAYYEMGARGAMQIDSFSYGDGITWLCEVNYRKTMGYIVNKLKRLVPQDDSIAFLMTPKNWIKDYKSHSELLYVLEDLEGVFPLSPIENPLYCWLVSAKERKELLSKSKELWALVGKKEIGFPSIYNKILPDTSTPEIESPI